MSDSILLRIPAFPISFKDICAVTLIVAANKKQAHGGVNYPSCAQLGSLGPGERSGRLRLNGCDQYLVALLELVGGHFDVRGLAVLDAEQEEPVHLANQHCFAVLVGVANAPETCPPELDATDRRSNTFSDEFCRRFTNVDGPAALVLLRPLFARRVVDDVTAGELDRTVMEDVGLDELKGRLLFEDISGPDLEVNDVLFLVRHHVEDARAGALERREVDVLFGPLRPVVVPVWVVTDGDRFQFLVGKCGNDDSPLRELEADARIVIPLVDAGADGDTGNESLGGIHRRTGISCAGQHEPVVSPPSHQSGSASGNEPDDIVRIAFAFRHDMPPSLWFRRMCGAH